MKISFIFILCFFFSDLVAAGYKIQQQKMVNTPKKTPNILLFIVNGLRADPPYESDELKAWKRQNLPFQTMMAERGVVFRNHYTNTNGSSPAKSTLHTGQYPNVHGVTQTLHDTAGAEHGLIPYTVPTIGNWLREAGYKTMLKGKWQVAESSIRLNDGTELTTFDAYGQPIASLCDFYLKKNVLCDFGYDGWIGPDPGSRSYLDAGSSVDETVLGRDPKISDQLIASLDALKQERKPWFLVGSYVNPFDVFFYETVDRSQEPWDFTIDATLPDILFTDDFYLSMTESLHAKPLPQVYWREVAATLDAIDGAIALPIGDLINSTLKALILAALNYTPPSGPLSNLPVLSSPRACSLDDSLVLSLLKKAGSGLDVVKLYYTLQKKVDQEMMRVWQTMVDNGMEDNTVVIFTSDHGLMLGAHGLLSGNLYEAYQESIHVPLMISSPFFNPEQKNITQLTSHIDVLPTILDIAHVDREKTEEKLAKQFSLILPQPGQSLLMFLIAQGISAGDSPVYFYTEDNPAAVFMPKYSAVEALVNYVDDTMWKLTHYYDPFGRPQKNCHESPIIAHELYDLTHDPMELHNLYGSENAAETQKILQKILDEAAARYRIIPGYTKPLQAKAFQSCESSGSQPCACHKTEQIYPRPSPLSGKGG